MIYRGERRRSVTAPGGSGDDWWAVQVVIDGIPTLKNHRCFIDFIDGNNHGIQMNTHTHIYNLSTYIRIYIYIHRWFDEYMCIYVYTVDGSITYSILIRDVLF